MEIVQKGATAEIGGMKQFMVTLAWTTATDFDLAALYETKSGEQGLCYFGNMGDLNAMPYMKLSGDEGVGDTGGDNKEEMRVTSLDDMAKVHVICWDYGAVQAGTKARFSESDVKVSLMDDQGTNHNVKLDTGDMGNVSVVATIDNTSPMGAKLVNTSKIGTLKGLSNSDQLFAIVNG